jgi:ferredoxin
MKAIVDQDTCTGCELCPGIAPNIFEMHGAKARVIADPVPDGEEEAATEAAQSCPVDAIEIKE